MKQNQRDCVVFVEKFYYSAVLFAFVNFFEFGFVFVFVSVFVFVFIDFDNVNIINIKNEFVKKIFSDEKKNSRLLR